MPEPVAPGTQLLRCQYLHFCTSKASKVSRRGARSSRQRRGALWIALFGAASPEGSRLLPNALWRGSGVELFGRSRWRELRAPLLLTLLALLVLFARSRAHQLACVKALFRRYSGSITALLRRYSGAITALFRRYQALLVLSVGGGGPKAFGAC